MKMQLKWGFASMLAASTLLAANTAMAATPATPPTFVGGSASVVEGQTVSPILPQILRLNGSTLIADSVTVGNPKAGTASCTNTATALSCSYTANSPYKQRTDSFSVKVQYQYTTTRGVVKTGFKSTTFRITISKPPVSR